MAIDTTSQRTRRAILMGALGGLMAAVAATAGRAAPASAADNEVMHVANSYSGTGPTELDVSGSANAAFIGVNDTGYGIWGSSTQSAGVEGHSFLGVGVRGWSYGNKTGILGYSTGSSAVVPVAPAKTGVYGVAKQDAASIGVYGRSDSGTGVYGTSPNGTGVYGDSAVASGIYGLSTASNAAATVGRSQGGSTGIQGFSGPGDLPQPPSHTGVFGSSPAGRGGQFSGGKAQLRLVPSSLPDHPTSGKPGDVFLDQSYRLWFCKGGATWRQIV